MYKNKHGNFYFQKKKSKILQKYFFEILSKIFKKLNFYRIIKKKNFFLYRIKKKISKYNFMKIKNKSFGIL